MSLSKARDRERKRLMKLGLDSNLKTVDIVQPKEEIPLYNPMKHHVGDKVRVNGRVVVIPELDADGNPIPW